MNNIETLILEKIRFEYGTWVPKDVISNMTVEQVVDFETQAVKTLFRTLVLGREVKEEVVECVTVYRTWWDHFKASCFPEFLRLRFPARYKREPITIKHYHLCPHTGLDFGHHYAMEHFNFLKGDITDGQ